MKQILPEDIFRMNPHMPPDLKTYIRNAKKISILQGRLNQVFLLDQNYILRTKKIHISTHDDIGGCLNFKEAVDLLEQKGFSFHPHILLSSGPEDHQSQMHEYLLYQHIKGTPLSSVFHTLSDTHIAHVAKNTAQLMSSLHTISTPQFGFFHGERFPSWIDYIEHWLKHQTPYILNNSLLSRDEVIKIQHIFKKNRTCFNINPFVVHLDFRPSNLIVDEKMTVISIIDWDNARGGDPIADVAYTLTRAFKDDAFTTFSHHFLKEYLSVTNVDKSKFAIKMKLYQLFYAFKLLPVHAIHTSDTNESPVNLAKEIRTILNDVK